MSVCAIGSIEEHLRFLLRRHPRPSALNSGGADGTQMHADRNPAADRGDRCGASAAGNADDRLNGKGRKEEFCQPRPARDSGPLADRGPERERVGVPGALRAPGMRRSLRSASLSAARSALAEQGRLTGSERPSPRSAGPPTPTGERRIRKEARRNT